MTRFDLEKRVLQVGPGGGEAVESVPVHRTARSRFGLSVFFSLGEEKVFHFGEKASR